MALAATQPIIAWQAHDGRRVARVAGYDIIQSDLCGFRHVLPLPDPTALEAARRKANIKEEALAFPPQISCICENGDGRRLSPPPAASSWTPPEPTPGAKAIPADARHSGKRRRTPKRPPP